MPKRPYTAPLPASGNSYSYGPYTGGFDPPVKANSIPATVLENGWLIGTQTMLAGELNLLKYEQGLWFEEARKLTEFTTFETTGAVVRQGKWGKSADLRPSWSQRVSASHNGSVDSTGTLISLTGENAYVIEMEIEIRVLEDMRPISAVLYVGEDASIVRSAYMDETLLAGSTFTSRTTLTDALTGKEVRVQIYGNENEDWEDKFSIVKGTLSFERIV